MGVGAEGRRFPTFGGSGDGAGAGAVGPRAGVMAWHQGRLPREDQEKVEVHLRLMPGGG